MAASAEDIPVARRTLPARPGRFPLLSRLGLLALGVSLSGAAAAIVFREPLRQWFSPPPVAGLSARTGADGRLLGHFPYPEVSVQKLVEVAPGQLLHRDAAAAVVTMQRAAAADGIRLEVLSGFRPAALQKELFFGVKSERNQSAMERAQVSAPPGFSEHSTGYAVDLGDGHAPQSHLSVAFETTAAFAWLRTNAARHHFILSFPPDNSQGVSYEPWHWRFEGTAEALKVFEPAHRLQRERG